MAAPDSCAAGQLRPAAFFAQGEVLGAAVCLALANGLAGKVLSSVAQVGFADAAYATFQISLVVLAAGVIGLRLLWRAKPFVSAGPLDYGVAGAAALLALVPFAPLSWLALTALALQAIRAGERQDPMRRAGWILLSVAGSFFWTKLLFAMCAPTILSMDAMLAATMLGVERTGNIVQFANGAGSFQVYPACSSLGNVSVGLVCWVTAVNCHRPAPWTENVAVALAIVLLVVLINVVRLALIGLMPEHFEVIHGAVGSTVTEWLTLLAVVGASAWGVRGRPALA